MQLWGQTHDQVFDMVYADGTLDKKTLPGSALPYGAYGLANICFSFIWSMYLLVGPVYHHLCFLLGKVRSVTTDMGTEIGFIDCPNFVDAFLRRLQGEPLASLQVDKESRLLPNAVRMSGWSHMFGNLMKFCTRCITCWPNCLPLVRALCKFFSQTIVATGDHRAQQKHGIPWA